MNNKVFAVIVVAVLMFLAFMSGKSLNTKEVVTKVNAEPVIESEMTMMSSGVRYEKVYAYGLTFIIFTNSYSGDMEVFCIQ